MPQVGVEAVVQGLSSFLSDIGKMNSSIKSLDTSGNAISRTFGALGNVLSGLGQSMLRVAEVALGVLVRDAFRAIISSIGEIISSTIEAGAAFQVMELRLNMLNLRTDSINGNMTHFNALMTEAKEITKIQLKWLQRLAVTTPFDAEDIANVFTLARSYGFAGKQAQTLTEDISNFAAGMGLGNTEIQRIIVNFGQMVQQGKVTQREMNDLARGAFVPVNDVLKKMQENVGLTGKAFDDFRNSQEGVQAFMEAFSDVVNERFTGAATAMARTFKGATDNAKDFVQSLIGFGVVRPVLNAIGGKIADMIDSLTTPERWDALTAAAENVGTQLSGVVEGVLNLLPSTEDLAGNIVTGLENVGDWIANNKDNIINFFRDMGNTIREDVIPFIRDQLIPAFQNFGNGVSSIIQNQIVPFIQNRLIPAFQKISDWATANGPLIQRFFDALGTIARDVIGQLTGIDVGGGGLDAFLGGVTAFMQVVIDNKQIIADFVALLIKLWGIFQLIGFVLTIVMGPFIALFGFIAGVIGVVIGAIAVFQVLGAVLAFLATPIGLVIALIAMVIAILLAIVAAVVLVIQNWDFLKEKWNEVVQAITDRAVGLKDSFIAVWNEMIQNVTDAAVGFKNDMVALVENIKTNFIGQPWGMIGRAIIEGIAAGVRKAADMLISAAVSAAEAAINAVKEALGVQSPSKVFMGLGENMMEGMAIGIAKMTKLASGAMQEAVGSVTMPAIMATAQMGGAVSNQNSYTNNYNLTVNSSSPAEPIIQDYNMLKSLAGAG